MYHCERRGRGIHIRGVTPTNVVFNKDCTYQRMLEKCSSYSSEEREKATFYVADSRGVPIWTNDHLVIDGEDGREKKVPWTLTKYIEYSHVKYPSKAKFFSVFEMVSLGLICTKHMMLQCTIVIMHILSADCSESEEQMDDVRQENPDGAEGMEVTDELKESTCM